MTDIIGFSFGAIVAIGGLIGFAKAGKDTKVNINAVLEF